MKPEERLQAHSHEFRKDVIEVTYGVHGALGFAASNLSRADHAIDANMLERVNALINSDTETSRCTRLFIGEHRGTLSIEIGNLPNGFANTMLHREDSARWFVPLIRQTCPITRIRFLLRRLFAES